MASHDNSDEYDGRKHTRFPFLAIARCMVAAVVSLLTVVVVVMVTIVSFRPEKATFSISHQYIQADRQWWVSTTYYSTAPDAQTTGAGAAATATVVNTDAAAGTATTISTSFGDGSTETTTTYYYSPVQLVWFWVSLTAGNPSGRADIAGGESFSVTVLDRPSDGSFLGLKELVTYELQDRFPLKRQTSHTLEEWVRVNDTAVMSYLAKKYGGLNSFLAMVKVNDKTAAKGKKPQIYYCWPVTVGTSSSYYYDNPASCRPEKEMDSPVSTEPVPALAPAPSPTAGY